MWRSRSTSPTRARGLACAAVAAIAAIAVALAAPLYAGAAGDAPSVPASPFGIDLSLSGNPFESSVRVPLTGSSERPPGSITPYVSAGATDPSRTLGATSTLPPREIEASRTSQRMDVGAGLKWNLTERLQLFGEMGFERAREQSYSLFGADGNRDGTYVKGGFTIRVP